MNDEMNPITPDNEVARLREENEELKLSEAALSEELKISDDWLKHTRNQVDQLRTAIEWIANDDAKHDSTQYYRTVAREALRRSRLAPAPEELFEQCQCGLRKPIGAYFCRRCAPEEPVNPTCSNTTHKFSHCDCTDPVSLDPAPKIPYEGNNDAKVKQPEWRELLPEEEIQTGDQVQAKHHDRVHGVWYDVFPYEIGYMPIHLEAFRYRTRRPLCPNNARKQEEPPLAEEPVTEKDTEVSVKKPISTPADLNQPNKENTVYLNEWRDLLPDELICEGDEYYTGKWTKITGWIGYPASNFARVRTCRKPLDEELKDIDQYADKQNDFYTCRVFQSIEYSLHYLRDEIQKLKEAR